MAPRELMIIGLFTGIVAFIGAFSSLEAPTAAFLAFAGGMVFGKGYGIFEERSR